MIIKDTVQVGNKIIRIKSKNIANPRSKVVQIIVKNLIDSMHHHELVGMAAPQIGENVRIFVTEIRETKLRKDDNTKNVDALRVFINPKIITTSKNNISGWEGCGSVAFAGLFGTVKRPASIIIEALDEKGIKFKLKANGLLARVVQHEIDHLNGIVFTDKADTKTYMSRSEYTKLRTNGKIK